MSKHLIKVLAMLCAALVATPLQAKTANYRLLTETEVEPTSLEVTSLNLDNARNSDLYLVQPISSRGKGITFMVLGIVFTAISGLTFIGSVAFYSAANDYDCNKYKKKGYEDENFEDGNGHDDEDWRKARHKCENNRESQMESNRNLAAVSAVALAGSVFSLIYGVRTAFGSAENRPLSGFDVVFDPGKNFSLVWNKDI